MLQFKTCNFTQAFLRISYALKIEHGAITRMNKCINNTHTHILYAYTREVKSFPESNRETYKSTAYSNIRVLEINYIPAYN